MNKVDLLKNKIFKGTFWLSFSSLFSKFFSSFAVIIIARNIGKENFGYFSTIQNTIIFFSVFTIFGLDLTITKFVSENIDNKDKLSEIITSVIKLSITIILLFFSAILFFSDIISNYFLNDVSLSKYIILMLPCLVLITLNSIIFALLLGLNKFKYISISNIIGAISYLLSSLLLSKLLGIRGSFISFSIYNFFLFTSSVIFTYITFKENYIRLDFKSKFYLGLFTKFSFPSFLSSLIVSFTFWYPISLITYTKFGYNENAIFNASNQIKNIILIIPTALSSTLLPFFSALKDKNDLKKLLLENLFYTFTFSLIIFIFTYFTSNILMSISGKEFANESTVLVTLALSTIFQNLSSVLGQVILSLGKVWEGLLINLIWSFITLTIFIFFNDITAVGFANAILIGYIIHFINSILLVKIKLKSNEYSMEKKTRY